MNGVVATILESGMTGIRIDIECHISNGLPNIIVVGFGNKAVDEAKERMRSAFAEANVELPKKRITLNLAPADVPKDGTSFDLAMAAAILTASKQIAPSVSQSTTMVVGELGLDGTVRPVRGIIGKILAARKLGYSRFYIPVANTNQAILIPDIEVLPVRTLRDFYLDQTMTVPIKPASLVSGDLLTQTTTDTADFADVIGQARAKRALEIAAAGGHNSLLSGPPGTGKSMLAKALPSILPKLSPEEILEVTHLHSLASQQYEEIVTTRPFRAPHHTASEVSILGGGQRPRPGEISLSHRGVLFFDELPEYSRHTLESLRQPLEDKIITVARAKDTLLFPADFMLIATANPCPCGYYGSTKACSCTASDIVRYQRKLSGPIMDRIDLYVDVDDVEHRKLLASKQAEPSFTIAARVARARKAQQKRFGQSIATNATMTNRQIKQHALLAPAAKEILDAASDKLKISARAYMRIVKVARTIADLEDSTTIEIPHVTEALQYRRPQNTI